MKLQELSVMSKMFEFLLTVFENCDGLEGLVGFMEYAFMPASRGVRTSLLGIPKAPILTSYFGFKVKTLTFSSKLTAFLFSFVLKHFSILFPACSFSNLLYFLFIRIDLQLYVKAT
jgi:hypothetical protein